MTERILITGASRGIGAATARHLAGPGRELLLMARTATDLAARCREIEARGGRADHAAVDLAAREGLEAAFAAIERAGPLDGIVLNAGVANGRMFRDADRASIQREIDLNYVAPAALLGRLLPGMVARGGGCVVVVGSLTSMIPFPGNATYSASKAALLSLVRSVRFELRGTGVHLGVVLPGYTATRMTADVESPFPAMAPERVAAAIARCYERRRTLVVPGLLNRLASRLFMIFPQTADRLLMRVSRLVLPRHAS